MRLSIDGIGACALELRRHLRSDHFHRVRVLQFAFRTSRSSRTFRGASTSTMRSNSATRPRSNKRGISQTTIDRHVRGLVRKLIAQRAHVRMYRSHSTLRARSGFLKTIRRSVRDRSSIGRKKKTPALPSVDDRRVSCVCGVHRAPRQHVASIIVAPRSERRRADRRFTTGDIARQTND